MKEQPSTGGSYVRQNDGTLKRVGANVADAPKAPQPAPRRTTAAAKQPEK